MSESDPLELAKRLTAALREFNQTSQRVMEDNVALGKVIGTRSDATADSLMIATLAAQSLALTKIVGEIGVTLAEHLRTLAEP